MRSNPPPAVRALAHRARAAAAAAMRVGFLAPLRLKRFAFPARCENGADTAERIAAAG
jgi:hypothetical protein